MLAAAGDPDLRRRLLQRYSLSEEEFAGWERDFADRGLAGLFVTKQMQRPATATASAAEPPPERHR